MNLPRGGEKTLADVLGTRYNRLGSDRGVSTGSSLDNYDGPQNHFEPQMTPAYQVPVHTDTGRSRMPEMEAAYPHYPPRVVDARQYAARKTTSPLEGDLVGRSATTSTDRTYDGSISPDDSDTPVLEKYRRVSPRHLGRNVAADAREASVPLSTPMPVYEQNKEPAWHSYPTPGPQPIQPNMASVQANSADNWAAAAELDSKPPASPRRYLYPETETMNERQENGHEGDGPRPLNYLPVFQPPKFAQLSGPSGAIVELI